MLLRMKTMNLLVCGVALALLVGCATTFRPWSLSEIQEGMDKAQVVKILGEPDYVEMKDGAEYLHYTYREEPRPVDDISVASQPVQNRRLDEFQRNLREYRYAVIMSEGKVVRYEELTD